MSVSTERSAAHVIADLNARLGGPSLMIWLCADGLGLCSVGVAGLDRRDRARAG